MRPWLALVGPLLGVVVLTAAPAGVQAGELPWPKWVVAGLVAAGGVLVGVGAPLLKAHTDALAARTTRAAEREAKSAETLGRLPTRNGKIPLVKEFTDRALLGIHEAIPLPVKTAISQVISSELPIYVPRDIDESFRSALNDRRDVGGFFILVGPAAVGKTRCAYEAIREVLPDWNFVMPGDAITLTELVNNGADLTRSVVWLDEIQKFLIGADRVTATTIRRMLTDAARPVILIGTIWPTTYEQLRVPADNVEIVNEGVPERDDLNKESREILRLARRINVDWSEQEWDRAEDLASLDPRLEQAVRHRGNGGLTQLLAAAPELINRWGQADNSFGKAVVTATAVARICGHPDVVPESVIESVAQHLLSGNKRAVAREDWLPEALSWACEPIFIGADISLIQPFSELIGQTDGYEVSDIIVNHIETLEFISGPRNDPDVWTRLIQMASPEACFPIGLTAHRYGYLDVALSAAKRAAGEAGMADAMNHLGILLNEWGDTEGARTWYTRGAESGSVDAMFGLGIVLAQQGEMEGARAWYSRAASAGNSGAMNNLGIHLKELGELKEALMWCTRSAEAGDPNAMNNLGILLEEAGDFNGAYTWYVRASDGGDTNAMNNLGTLLMKNGRSEESLDWYTRGAEAGNINAMEALISILISQDKIQDAHPWMLRATDNGSLKSMYNLGAFAKGKGDLTESVEWLQRAAEGGYVEAMFQLGNLLAIQGDTERAKVWHRRAVDLGHVDAMFTLGAVLGQEGDVIGLLRWWRRAAKAGQAEAAAKLASDAMQFLAALHPEQDDDASQPSRDR